MTEEKYIMWTDGALTSMGVLVSKSECGCITVKNPVVIIFQTEETPMLDENGEPLKDENGAIRYKGTLRWDITPYVFNACLKTGENIWKGRPAYVLEECEFVDELLNHYKHVIKVTGPVGTI